MSPQEKRLMKGNDAIAEAAVRAGCTAYFGYPITPQNEIIAYMAKVMLDKGRVFIQAESETAAINMVYGASAAGADLPLVLVNVVRGGPGLGSIAPSQSDYFQSTRGGGHGDYFCIVLAPKSVQECADLTYLAFDLADQYRTPVILLADGMIGQMMEGVVLPPERSLSDLPKRDWTVGHKTHRESRHISSLHLVPEELEASTKQRFARYEKIKEQETRFEWIKPEGGEADLTFVAYGTSARVALGAKKLAEQAGIRLGVFRPITLWPFPFEALGKIAETGKPLLTVEMSLGQLVEDVKLAVLGKAPVHLLGHSGGVIPTEEEVFAEAKRILTENRRKP